jgi:extracellular elastinolytic metalloproteinase
VAAATISEEEAIARAAFDLTDVTCEAADFSPPGSDPYRFYQFTPGEDSPPSFDRSIRVKDVMFALDEGQFIPG